MGIFDVLCRRLLGCEKVPNVWVELQTQPIPDAEVRFSIKLIPLGERE